MFVRACAGVHPSLTNKYPANREQFNADTRMCSIKLRITCYMRLGHRKSVQLSRRVMCLSSVGVN